MHAIRPLVAALAFASVPFASAGTPTLTELGRSIPGYWSTSEGDVAVADFDRDGRDDIVVPGHAGTSLFQVLGYEDGALVVKQAVFVPDTKFARVTAVSIAGEPHLVTVSIDGVVRQYTGWPLAEVHAFDAGRQVDAAALGDIDNDGAMDVVLASDWWLGEGVSAYGLDTGELRWNLPDTDGSDILIGQFDGDPAKEIVLAATPGRVIDGATLATDWSYPDGFGNYLAGGRFQAGGGEQLVIARDWGLLMAFQSAPWSPMWDMKFFDIDALTTFDLDGDGFDEIIEGDGQSGDLHIIDGQTHAIRLSIPHEGSGLVALATWDPEADGKADIAFAPRSALPSRPLFTLADSLDGHTIGELPSGQEGPYRHLALGRVGAGTRLVYPVRNDGYFGGAWVEIEALTGQVLWQSPTATDPGDPFMLRPGDAVYSADASGDPLLVLAGAGVTDDRNRLIALDALTHESRWTLDAATFAPLTRELQGASAFELANGPTIGACLLTYTDARILLVDAASGTPLWTSVAMTTEGGECGLMAGRFHDGNPLVVAVLHDSLRAYDSVTHVLAWSLEVPADGASLIEQGVAGREFVVFEGTQLRFYDAATRTELRAFDLGMPIHSVRQARDDIHGLLVAAGGHLLLVDGTNGAIRQATDYLGSNLATGNRIGTADLGGGYTRVGVGSDGGVIRFRLYTGDGIFTDGFEPAVD